MRQDSIDQLLTTLFMLLAVAAMVVYFVVEKRVWFYSVGGIAIALRIFQYIRRAVIRRKRIPRATDIDI